MVVVEDKLLAGIGRTGRQGCGWAFVGGTNIAGEIY